jgi:quercetin dioxygenase-like cupin family protein
MPSCRAANAFSANVRCPSRTAVAQGVAGELIARSLAPCGLSFRDLRKYNARVHETDPNAPALATIAGEEDGEAVWALGGLLIFKVSGLRTGGRFSVLEERMVRGCATPAHRHRHDDETFVVLEGELGLWIEGERSVARAGGVAFVPAGLVHAWRVESDFARTIVITTPEHEQFYREAGRPAPALVQPPDAGVVDIATIRRAAAKHGVELFGPPWTGDEPVFATPPGDPD